MYAYVFIYSYIKLFICVYNTFIGVSNILGLPLYKKKAFPSRIADEDATKTKIYMYGKVSTWQIVDIFFFPLKSLLSIVVFRVSMTMTMTMTMKICLLPQIFTVLAKQMQDINTSEKASNSNLPLIISMVKGA